MSGTINIQHNGYCQSLSRYKRRPTITVNVGSLMIGNNYPIRIQSMTTTDTMDTKASVAQALRMVEAGCELVRLTAPSIREAENLSAIKKELIAAGCHVPLVADIHFTPNAAELAARIVEKVRINPGNYADKKRFETIEYTDQEYAEELERIRDRFLPLVKICKEYGTAMRIGTNHGSLSDRIMSRYGDNATGMVESALEFLRICEDEGYHNIVLSMKASNPEVMVQANRLLVKSMNELGMHYPIHLGVTEAGDGDDGRIKSALGIGAMLEDGIGDTIRVSLTEDPEFEVPVARALADRYVHRATHDSFSITQPWEGPLKAGAGADEPWLKVWNPYVFQKRQSTQAYNIGDKQVGRVIADFSDCDELLYAPPETWYEKLAEIGHTYDPVSDKWHSAEAAADFVYFGHMASPVALPATCHALYKYETWMRRAATETAFPVIRLKDLTAAVKKHSHILNFLLLDSADAGTSWIREAHQIPNLVIILSSHNQAAMPDMRNVFLHLNREGGKFPVILMREYSGLEEDLVKLYAATDAGTLLSDGFGNGLMLKAPNVSLRRLNEINFGILQAARVRISKTEFISCPSCGRTLFDLQETTNLIRNRTGHLKGLKIAIMGCIVNGPGEMADADYGYVGSGPGKITLYRGREIIKRNVPSSQALDELVSLIDEDGNWREPVS